MTPRRRGRNRMYFGAPASEKSTVCRCLTVRRVAMTGMCLHVSAHGSCPQRCPISSCSHQRQKGPDEADDADSTDRNGNSIRMCWTLRAPISPPRYSSRQQQLPHPRNPPYPSHLVPLAVAVSLTTWASGREDLIAAMPIKCSCTSSWPFMEPHVLHARLLTLRPAVRIQSAQTGGPATPGR